MAHIEWAWGMCDVGGSANTMCVVGVGLLCPCMYLKCVPTYLVIWCVCVFCIYMCGICLCLVGIASIVNRVWYGTWYVCSMLCMWCERYAVWVWYV